MSKAIIWHKIANHLKEIEFQPNNTCIIEINSKKITLALYNENIYAVAHKCPHASGIMAEGYINAQGNIVCPLHRYAFSLKNGRNITGEGYYLKNYPVENNEDGIYVGIEKTGIFGIF